MIEMHTQRGFTFIEIMLVIMLLGVLAAVSLPRMGSTFHRAQVQAEARELVGVLRYARHTAILRGDGAEVRFDPERGEYELLLVDLDLEGMPGREYAPHARRYRTDESSVVVPDDVRGLHRLPDGVVFTLFQSSASPSRETKLPRVVYYPDGSASPARIAIKGNRSKELNVQIFRTTGMAMVKEGAAKLPEGTRPFYMARGR